MNNALKVLISAAVAFVYLFVISKMLGKKQIAEFDFINYVTGISIGSIAAEMATALEEKPMYLYLISMSVFFVFDFIIGFLERKGNKLEKFLKGSPIIVVQNGKINFKGLKKSKLTVNDVLSLTREKEYFDINDIAYGIYETNGTFSILPKANKSQVIAEDMKVKKEKAMLTDTLITDGSISKTSLKRLNKDKEWLFKKLNLDKQKLKKILLATYNESTKEFDVHYKSEE
jgi:uncharacterized membrane protein YcaP (DUF421 family)